MSRRERDLASLIGLDARGLVRVSQRRFERRCHALIALDGRRQGSLVLVFNRLGDERQHGRGVAGVTIRRRVEIAEPRPLGNAARVVPGAYERGELLPYRGVTAS